MSSLQFRGERYRPSRTTIDRRDNWRVVFWAAALVGLLVVQFAMAYWGWEEAWLDGYRRGRADVEVTLERKE